MSLNSFQEAVDYLYSSLPVFHRQGPAAYKADIGNISRLMEFAGDPHKDNIQFIHVAGTNGKGSVSHLLAAYIRATGKRCGLYTSPHYFDIRERIKIDGELISEIDFTALLNFYLPVIQEIQPSFFEIICAMAFSYFHQQKVDFAIIEVGMGGRLDSTNILRPVCSVITNISLDHTAFLGKTPAEIAVEKAGIIKQGIPVLIGERQIETEDVFEAKAKELDAPLYFADSIVRVSKNSDNTNSGLYNINFQKDSNTITVSTRLNAGYQLKNIRTFSAVVYVLDKYKILPYNSEFFRIALEEVHSLTNFIGRWQLIHNSPRVIVDSAHNLAGIQELIKQLSSMKYAKVYIIFGTVDDKDVRPILDILPAEGNYIWTQAEIPRAMKAEKLAELGVLSGLSGSIITPVYLAVSSALTSASPDDLILVCGSIFVVGELLANKQFSPFKL
ncbi:MAG TPA: folylpolyglutamate synthase/dihydrofolate synthase family protein [Saprospiraceae bacterium]|nr:folylpolyglutamate synthase/dihydrofolate synthase family protein [Saprospiraceae bacterium]